MLEIILRIMLMLYVSSAHAQNPDEVVFNQIKPFLYFENGKFDGIFPSAINRLHWLCNISREQQLVNYELIKSDLDDKNIRSIFLHTDYSNAELENITGINTIWLPIMQSFENEIIKKVVKIKVLFQSPSIAVITHRDKISLTYKFLKAIERCQQTIFLIFGLVLFSAILMWFLECLWNKDFSKWFFKGFGVGIYWAFVTVSTVGYGDVTPKTFIGRCFSVLWMGFGIFMFSALTGTFGATLSDTSYLQIKNKPVAAMENSYAFNTARNNYDVTLSGEYLSHDEILDAVNSEEVEFGLVNVDVMAYVDRKKYENIAVIDKIYIEDPIIMLYTSGSMFEKNICLKEKLDESLAYVIERDRKVVPIETEYVETVWQYITDNDHIKYACIIFLVLLFICLIGDVVHYAHDYFKTDKYLLKKSIHNGNINMAVIQNGKESRNESYDNRNIKDDVNSIKEQIAKLYKIKVSQKKCPNCLKQPDHYVPNLPIPDY